jgi:hypothetical protein
MDVGIIPETGTTFAYPMTQLDLKQAAPTWLNYYFVGKIIKSEITMFYGISIMTWFNKLFSPYLMHDRVLNSFVNNATILTK